MTFALFEDDIIGCIPTASSASLHMRLSIIGPLRGPITTNANTPELRMSHKTAVYVHVYANVVLPNGLLCRKEHGSVYRDLVVIEPRRE